MKARTVAVYRADGGMAFFEDGDRLEDTDTLPRFYLEISTLFALWKTRAGSPEQAFLGMR